MLGVGQMLFTVYIYENYVELFRSIHQVVITIKQIFCIFLTTTHVHVVEVVL